MLFKIFHFPGIFFFPVCSTKMQGYASNEVSKLCCFFSVCMTFDKQKTAVSIYKGVVCWVVVIGNMLVLCALDMLLLATPLLFVHTN